MSGFIRKFLTFLFALVLVAIGGWLAFFRDKDSNIEYPQYLSFIGNYAFTVPRDYRVLEYAGDDQTIKNLQIVSKGNIQGKTIDQIYEENNITLQPIDFLKDKKSETFTEYVNGTFVPDEKKRVQSEDIRVEFSKNGSWDTAKITVNKDGQQLRYIQLKNGEHPVSIVSKQETEAFKKIASTVSDVEKTDLNKEVEPLKTAARVAAQQLRDKKAEELYVQASNEFRSKNTQDDIAKLLDAEEVYSQGAVTINGGSYDGSEFGAVINFVPLNKDFEPASGVLYYVNIDGQWKIRALELPNPLSNRVGQ